MADLGSTRVFGKLTVMHDAIVKANAEITGSVTAASFAGDGSLITALNAAAIATGTVPDARLPTTATRWPAWSEVTSKPNFVAVATSGAYSDLSGVPVNATPTVAGLMSSADKGKLDDVESGATADQTKADIDSLGVDADTLDGKHASAFQEHILTQPDSGSIIASDWNSVTEAGFYDGSEALNETPFKSHKWQHTLCIVHSNNNGYSVQLAKGVDSGDPWSYRVQHGGTWESWKQVWSEDNDGDGSGLDADLVGGKKVTVSATAPATPNTNDIWLDIS